MNNSIIRLQFILDSVPLTSLQRSEANAHLVELQNKYKEISSEIERLRNEINELKK